MAIKTDVAAVCSQLMKRADNLDKIATEEPLYYSVRAAVQRAAASVRLTSVLLEEAVTTQQAFLLTQENELQDAKKRGSALAKVTEYRVNLAMVSAGQRLVELVNAAAHIANERDVESLKVFAKKAGETVAKVAMIISGVELVKVAGEILASAMDVFDTSKAAKNRANQAKIASSLLQWLEIATLACLTWAVEAQMLINHFQRKDKDNDIDTVLDQIVQRAVGLAR